MPLGIKPGWSKPSAILFAAEFPTDEKAFSFALAHAFEFGANLIIFHAYDRTRKSEPAGASHNFGDYTESHTERSFLDPLAERARMLGIHCSVVARPGSASEQILAFIHGRRVDRVVMGAHSPGPIGKLLVGSVAEAVLRNADVPVCIVGPNVVEGTFRSSQERKILCDVSKAGASSVVASFGAELAARQRANLILHLAIPPQERNDLLADRTLEQIEAELPSLVPIKLKNKVPVQTRVTLGDPIEELLYQSRAQRASLIVMGAQGASQFAAVTRAAIVYKVLAYAHCPVVTLSPVLLDVCGAREELPSLPEVNYIAGVI